MHIEAEPSNGIRSVIARKIRDIAGGHSLKDKARIKRIINCPSSISLEDIWKYKQKKLDSLIPLGTNMSPFFSILPNLNSFFEEQKRQKRLTPEQLTNEVIEDAQRQAEEWKLK